MAVYARPDGDLTGGSWRTAGGSSGPLWAQIDETSHDEGDYVTVNMSGGPAGITYQYTQATAFETLTGTDCTYRWCYAAGVADDYHSVLILMPDSIDRGDCQVVNWFHGVTGNEQQVIQNLGSGLGADALVQSWLDRGWAVVSWRYGISGVVGPTSDNNDGKWANSSCRAAWQAGFQWLEGLFTTSDGFLFCGASAGGQAIINALMDCKSVGVACAAAALIDPCTNLRWAYNKNYETDVTSNSGGLDRTKIINAYDIQNHSGTSRKPYVTESEWTDPVDVADDGHDPQQIDLDLLPSIPFYFIASTADTTVDVTKNADYWLARLAGWSEEVAYSRVSTGGHNNAAHFRPTEINPFYDRALS